jgi:hypothetical protein
VPEAFIWNAINSAGLPQFQGINYFPKVKVTLQLTVSQSVSLGVDLHLGLMTRYLLNFDSYGLVFLLRPL